MGCLGIRFVVSVARFYTLHTATEFFMLLLLKFFMLLKLTTTRQLLIATYFALLLIPQMVYADKQQSPEAGDILPVMPEVQVEATRIAPTTGTVIIDKEMIENLPTRNGSINEIISTVPGVQYGETTLSSFTAGEITPPVVSISGSRFYDNNYTIDGMGNNNPLDPAFNIYAKDSIRKIIYSGNTNKLPSHPQIHFLSPQLIEQITVYNSNIPAEFGGFTGGQVDTKTISPDETFWGKINYRTTSYHWTRFHIDPYNENDFYNSTTPQKQPEFQKHDFGMTLNTPLTGRTGLLTSYHQLYSEIPLKNLGKTDTQTRRQENFFFKLSHELNAHSQLSLTALYSPTAASYFPSNTINGIFNIKQKNYSLLLNIESSTNMGQLEINIGYTDQKTERKSPPNFYRWDSATDSIDWSEEKYGYVGGRGNLNTGQKALSLKTDMDFNRIALGETQHHIKVGAEVTYSYQYYDRPMTNYYYYSHRLSSTVICEPDDTACIDGEQYLVRRTKYSKADVDAEITDVAAYIQDSIVWKRLELFPGIRISYDDFTSNSNIAPRLSASLDVFGNRRTILFAGNNRYYSGTLLTHALYKGIVLVNQQRVDNTSDWGDQAYPTSYRYEDTKVKTPYSDELTVGIIQKVLGGELKIQYLEKNSHDEFTRNKIDNPDPEADIYILKNDGRSEHKSYQLSWQRSWKNHFLEINGTWQETTTSNDDYSATVSENDLIETVWYKDEELNYYEIPRVDFNRPFVANLTYIGQLPYGLTFTNVTKYRDAYWKLKNTGDTRPSIVHPGEDSYIYEKVENKSSLLFDWRISWTIPQYKQQRAILSLDIYNVFDHRVGYNYQTGKYGYDYELGRQFWAGLEFNF